LDWPWVRPYQLHLPKRDDRPLVIAGKRPDEAERGPRLRLNADELAVKSAKGGQMATFAVAAWHAACKPAVLFTPLTSQMRHGQPELCGRPG
jgi:hypothetical protein